MPTASPPARHVFEEAQALCRASKARIAHNLSAPGRIAFCYAMARTLVASSRELPKDHPIRRYQLGRVAELRAEVAEIRRVSP